MHATRAIRKSRFTQTAGIAAITLLILVLLPVWAPYVAVSQAIRSRRMRVAANVTTCERCGSVLLSKALELANQKVCAEMAELRAKHPNAKFRTVRKLWAICPHCFSEFGWNERENFFVLLTDGNNA